MVCEAIVQMLRALNTRTGNGFSVLRVCPTIIGTFAYEAERDVLFMAAMWSLVRDGIIVPGQPAGMSNKSYVRPEALDFTHFTVTPFGREMLGRSEVVSPLEAEPYMRSARGRLGNADDSIYTYLAEARKSFSDGNHLSAIVMLGVSTEMFMKWLIGNFLDHLPDSKKPEFEKTRNDLWNRTDKLFDKFIIAIKSHFVPDGLSHDLELQVNAHLDQMQTLIWVNRDDVGHGRQTCRPTACQRKPGNISSAVEHRAGVIDELSSIPVSYTPVPESATP